MKKFLVQKIMVLVALLGMALLSNAQNVSIPDAAFKAALLAHDPVIDTNDDGEIQVSEAEAVTGNLVILDPLITDASGIQAFVNISSLWFQYTAITSLDISNSQSLVNAFLNSNDLTTVTIGNLPSLRILALNQNQLTSVDVSQLPALEILWTYGNSGISTLDVSQNPNLTHINTNSCSLTSIDVSNNPQLIELNITFNDIPDFDISNNLELQYLVAVSTGLQELDLRAHRKLIRVYVQDNALTSLLLNNGNNENITDSNFNISGNSGLTCVLVDDAAYSSSSWTNVDAGHAFSDTYCDINDSVFFLDENFKAALVGDNSINTNMDAEISYGEAEAYTGSISTQSAGIESAVGLEAFPNITFLRLSQNSITELDVSRNTQLTTLYFDRNLLSSINLSSNTSLTTIYGFSNELTEVTFPSGANSISYLAFQNNLLSNLDISSLSMLDFISVINNQLMELDISNNLLLEILAVGSNNLTEIDLSSHTLMENLYAPDNNLQVVNVKNGNNGLLTNFDVSGNENLTCVLVDDADYSAINWTNIDEQATFSDTYCDPNDPVYIPDANFKAALLANTDINTTDDGEITYGEAGVFSGILNVNGLSINDMTGIAAFASITELYCATNSITSLDVSNNTNLEILHCYSNQMTSLNVANCSNIIELAARTNNLTSIDVSDLVNVERLYLHSNQLTSINISNNDKISQLLISSNPDLASIDVSNLSDLVELHSGFSEITELDLSLNTELETLYCQGSNLTSLDLSNNPNLQIFWAFSNQLTSLNLKSGGNNLIVAKEPTANFRIANNNLTCVLVDDADYSTSEWTDIDEGVVFSDTYCDPNDPVNIPDANFKALLLGIGSLNTNDDDEISFSEAENYSLSINVNDASISDLTGIEAFVNIIGFSAKNNTINEIDLSFNTKLGTLVLDNNQLTSLDVSNNTMLTHLQVFSNQLSSIDVSNLPELRKLWVKDNQLTTLNTSLNPLLSDIECGENQITSLDLTNNTVLTTIQTQENNLALLDVSYNPYLFRITAFYNDLTSIDLSNNPLITSLGLEYNQLSTIDVSNLTDLISFKVRGNQLIDVNMKNGNNTILTNVLLDQNPNLTCIQVDDPAYSEANWTFVDESADFSTDCDVVVFEDEIFESVLVGNGNINTNDDAFIQLTEAAAYTGQIQASDDGINSIAGIEHFPNITILQVHGNNLESVDLSANTVLETLWLSRNELNSIDLIANTAITDLRIDTNAGLSTLNVGNLQALATLHAHTTSVEQIDLSNNSLLEDLVMHTTSLQSLDLTSNPNLWRVYVYDNQLSEFDLRNGNNSGITSFRAEGNDLNCISVNDIAYAETNWSSVDGAAAFSTDCSNGANDIIAFSFSEQNSEAVIDAGQNTVEIEVVQGTDLSNLTPTIDISEGASIDPEGAQDFTNPVTYTVTAENHDSKDWVVTVNIQNAVPVVANPLADASEDEGFGTFEISYANVFTDPDGDALTISVESSNPEVVTAVVVAGDQIEITEVGIGMSTITVTADDGNEGMVSETFKFTVIEVIPLSSREIDELKIYPNPTMDFINVKGTNESFSLRVLDLNGRTLMQTRKENEINLSDLNAGMYLLQIELADGSSKTIRITKNN